MTKEKLKHIQIRSFILGEFIASILNTVQDGYTYSEYETYRLGREYIADLRLPEVTATFEIEPVKKIVEPVEPVKKIVEPVEPYVEGSSPTDIPDWEKLDTFVSLSDKDGMEAYCRGFGIDLNKRKSPQNMLIEFKVFIGA